MAAGKSSTIIKQAYANESVLGGVLSNARSGLTKATAPVRKTPVHLAKRSYYAQGGPPRMWHDNGNLILGLIGANVAVFVMWKTLNPFWMFQHFTCTTEGIFRSARLHTLLTCSFSHTDIWHLLVNMLGLYYFGAGMLAYLGPRMFLSVYAGSAIVSSLAQIGQAYYERQRTVLMGASGAINCCVMFNVLMNPRATVLIYGIIPVPLAIFGIFIMFQDVFGAVSSAPTPGSTRIGYTSHLTGAACGALCFLVFRRRMF